MTVEKTADLDFSPNIKVILSKRMKWAGHVTRMDEKKNAFRVLVGRPGGRRPLGRHRRRWEDNIKIDLKDIGWEAVYWVSVAQNRGN
jgi:hypothetical protein